MKLKIATYNIQNKYKVKNYSGIDNKGNHVKEFVEFIEKNELDIVGTQELTRRFKKNLISYIKNYNIVGKYRFTSLASILPYLDKYNELNAVISNKKIINCRTVHLPSFPRVPRIMTIVDFVVNKKKIRVINTHLDNKSKKNRIKSFDSIYKKLSKCDIDTILMGDFNCTIEDEELINFLSRIEKIGYKRIVIDTPTHKIRKCPIDHIIIPKKWKVNKVDAIRLKEKISDHKPIVVELDV